MDELAVMVIHRLLLAFDAVFSAGRIVVDVVPQSQILVGPLNLDSF